MTSKITIFSILVFLGFLLSTLGLISFPVFNNINYFWPAAVVQAVGAILFGWIGVFAGTVFPIISNYFTDDTYFSTIAFIPSNFIQSFLPFFIYNRIRPNLLIKNARDGFLFSIFAGVIPQLAGGLTAAFILTFMNRIESSSDFVKMVFLWFVDSVPWIIFIGIPMMVIFVPTLKNYNCLYGQNQRAAIENEE